MMKNSYQRIFIILISIGLLIGITLLTPLAAILSEPTLFMIILIFTGIYFVLLLIFHNVLTKALKGLQSFSPQQVGGKEIELILFTNTLRPLGERALFLSFLTALLYGFPLALFLFYSLPLTLASFWFYMTLQFMLLVARSSTKVYTKWANFLIFYILRNYSKLSEASHQKAVVEQATYAIINQAKLQLPWIDELRLEKQIAVLALTISTGSKAEQNIAMELCETMSQYFAMSRNPIYTRRALEVLTKVEEPEWEAFYKLVEKYKIRVKLRRLWDSAKLLFPHLISFFSLLLAVWNTFFVLVLFP